MKDKYGKEIKLGDRIKTPIGYEAEIIEINGKQTIKIEKPYPLLVELTEHNAPYMIIL